jgi:hypothetical protein
MHADRRTRKINASGRYRISNAANRQIIARHFAARRHRVHLRPTGRRRELRRTADAGALETQRRRRDAGHCRPVRDAAARRR